MRMLCYGDSNTYAYDPRGFVGGRYPKESRWVDILMQRTGWEIRNEGQNGREIPSRPFQYQRAGELLAQSPPDVFAIMLGTNDLLRGYSAVETCSRMEAFLRYLQPKCGQLLLIAPPPMKRGAWVTEENLIAESVKLAAVNKEKTDSVLWNAVGQTIILGFRETQTGGCRGCYFRCRRGWTLGIRYPHGGRCPHRQSALVLPCLQPAVFRQRNCRKADTR